MGLGRALALAGLGIAAAAGAGPLDQLVMPGPVSRAHAEIEGECAKCHAPLEPVKQPGLCLDCHKDVRADIAAKQGFHGRTPSAGTRCSDCHAEHRGRSADLIGLVRETFDHRLTDFPLHGAHATVPCASCHAQGKPLREAAHECIGCHRDDDRHKGALGPRCADCHEDTAWRGGRFDHSKTKFPLENAHAKVQCVQCHPGERYADTPRACATCHAVDDVHRGSFGPACADCHSTQGWKTRRFDHARDTKFPLTGAHASTDCLTCHVGGIHAKQLSRDCVSCHRGDDEHRGRNGTQCGDCHDTTAWKTTRFDHDRTKFPLHGLHEDVPCAACHTQDVHTQKLPTDCASCHRSDDPHAGKEGTACERCHRETGWREVKFDHDLTRFPLLGLHATVACEECHASRVYPDTDSRCVACHAARDVHEKKLGPACATCHNPAGWTAWRFDHAKQTDFALHGAHESVPCTSCHTAPTDGDVSLRSDCGSCHARDDAHAGRFGRDCGRCHAETSWREVRIP